MFLVVLTFIATALSIGPCDNLTLGYYCYDKSIFLYCPGSDKFVESWWRCKGGSICKCGKTVSNPCAFDYSDVDFCNGRVGTYINSSIVTPPETFANDKLYSSQAQEVNESSSLGVMNDGTTIASVLFVLVLYVLL
ncbi:hypothetical protein EIN_411320 [Entamoeba invadens IP1]|uniref:Uncharacterized protein n=2 Tax=Entamoeba invadens TaxID=33085 RepID=A0A0A1U729_ENTIV|nr:hypothetical protein EIN_411320 [Entamoeba invadens IP1]ABC59327.1 Jessie 1c [Entamoeba invadens]ELP87779.1 hypothetical protein EIN_411320 [Entamoeba invadens IP1]|eukprot:XP_004254550.1 hypothetical protein EIN_411320 [Entamoeba invadens IP1]